MLFKISALSDIRKKWHIAPAFSVEFIGYYLDRISRTKELKASLDKMVEVNANLLQEQENLREEYDVRVNQNNDLKLKHETLQASVRILHKQLQVLCPTKTLPSVDHIGRPAVQIPNPVTPPARPMSVPTAAALKMGVGFPLAHLPGTKDDTGRILSTQSQAKNSLVRTHDCGICKRCNDQHLLAKCDTCHLHYHLGCLNPPLTRHPKKSKLYGWQCSECDKSDDSDAVPEFPKGPRKSRTRFSKDGTIIPVDLNLSSSNPDVSLSPGSSPVKRKSMDSRPATAKKTSVVEKTLTSIDNTANNLIQQQNGKSTKSRKKSIENVIPERKTTTKKTKVTDNMQLLQKPTVLLKDALKTSSALKTNPITINTSTQQQLRPTIDTITTIDLTLPDSPTKSLSKISSEDNDVIVIDDAPLAKGDNEVKDPLADAADPLDVPQPSALLALLSQPATPLSGCQDSSISKQNRKKRKDKHKSKYLSSDNEKSSIKEHKRKRKKKSHDHDSENLNNASSISGIPKIKIKVRNYLSSSFLITCLI